MYNRYIPQPDGSYQRSRMPEPQRPAPSRPPISRPEPEPEPCPEPPKISTPPPSRRPCPRRRPAPPKKEPPADTSVTGFLKKLLPKDFDTGDLMIVLLLLLMSGDCAEDQNTALLTLVLYLFM